MPLPSNGVLQMEGRCTGGGEKQEAESLCFIGFCRKIKVQWDENITYIYFPKW